MIIVVILAFLAVLGVAFYFGLHKAAVWTAMGQAIAEAIVSVVIPKVLKRKSPEGEAKDHQDVAEGKEHSDRPFGRQKGE